MKFKPIPDNIRCASIDSKHIAVARINGVWRAFVTDSDYVLEKIIEPALEDAEAAHIFTNEESHGEM